METFFISKVSARRFFTFLINYLVISIKNGNIFKKKCFRFHYSQERGFSNNLYKVNASN
jgi:hypothetical protein